MKTTKKYCNHECKRKSVYTILTLALLLAIFSCTPVHRLNRLKKVPREHRMNYCDGYTKSPRKFYWNKDPWIVFSDHEGNPTFTRPGGKIQMKTIGFMEPFLVIGRKNGYLRLVKYSDKIVKNGKLTNRKEAQYYGWIAESEMLLSRNAVTDLRSGVHNKYLTILNDTTPLNAADYFIADDSLVTFKDKSLTDKGDIIPFSGILYRMKQSVDKKKTLVSKVPYLSADSARYQVSGWVDNSFLCGIGQQHFITPEQSLTDSLDIRSRNGRDTVTLSENFIHETGRMHHNNGALKYIPVIYNCRYDSGSYIRTAFYAPVMDYRDNFVFNVNGNKITYTDFRKIEKDLAHINLYFIFEGKQQVIQQFPQLVNTIQNLQSMIKDTQDEFHYSYSGIMGFGTDRTGMKIIQPQASFMTFMDSLSLMVDRTEFTHLASSERSWPALRQAIKLAGQKKNETNLLVLIGETGNRSEWADSLMTRQLAENNCRILGFQLYGGQPDTYNNFVLQVENMIDNYTRIISINKREMLVSTDQLRNHYRYKERSRNMYSLDFPDHSMTQGWIVFPEKKQTNDLAALTNSIDTLLTEVREDNRQVARYLHKAFQQVGNYRTQYDSTMIGYYGLGSSKVKRHFADKFHKESPLWYLPSGIINIPDSVKSELEHHLLLTSEELLHVRRFLKDISARQVDYRTPKGQKKKKGKSCNCPDDLLPVQQWQEISDTLTVEHKYRGTRKIRRQLVRYYLRRANLNKVCRTKKKVLKRYTIARMHEHILTCPTNNPALHSIAIAKIKKKKYMSDTDLDQLLEYYKEKSEALEHDLYRLPKFTSNGETYYWINESMLP